MTQAPAPELVAQALRAVSASQGFNSWLGVDLVSVETGRVEITIPIRPDLSQHHGSVHGGVLAAAADIVCAWTAASVAGDVVTAGFSIQFLNPARGERLRAIGTVLKAGKRQAAIEAKVYAEAAGAEPKLVAAAMASVTPVG